MPSLSALDLAVVAAYVVGVTALGAWFTRRQTDLRTYFVGDRNVGWPLVLVSIVATETSAATFLSVPGKSFADGGNFTFLQLALGYALGRCLIAWFLLPQYARGEMFSAYQLLRERFSPAVQRVASALFLGTRSVADGLRLCLIGLLLHQFTGWDIRVAVLTIGGVTLIYTYLGGMQAVIWTDLLQFLLYLVGAVIAFCAILRLLPGGWSELLQAGVAGHKFALFDTSWDPTRVQTIWAGVIGGAVFSMGSHGADQNMVQRYLCARSQTQARLALVLSGAVVFFQFVLFLGIGVGLWALRDYGLLDVPRIAPDAGINPNDAAFGQFIVSGLPAGLVGVVTAAVLASAMASFSSSLNSSASAFVTDFYQPLRPGRSERHYLRVSKAMTSFWGVVKIATALVVLELPDRQSILDRVLGVAGVTFGLILGLFVLGSLRRRVRSGPALAGLLAGFAVVAALWLPTLFGTIVVAWPWFAPVGTLVTVAVALAVDSVAPSRARAQGAQRVA